MLNNERKLLTGEWQWSPVWCNKPNYDVTRQIELAQKDIKFKFSTQHVSGHQDDTKKWHELTRPEQMNVIADRMATKQKEELLRKFPAGPEPGPTLPAHTTQLYVDGKVVTAKEKGTMLKTWSTQELKKYYLSKFTWSPSTYHRVNWAAIKTVRPQLSDTQARFIIKLTIHWLPLNQRQHEHGGSSPACLACGAVETQEHLYRCPQRQQWRNLFIKALQLKLTELQTPIASKLTILDAVIEELTGTPPSNRDSVLQPESLLTWQDFLMGRIDRLWEQKMDTL